MLSLKENAERAAMTEHIFFFNLSTYDVNYVADVSLTSSKKTMIFHNKTKKIVGQNIDSKLMKYCLFL